jgi:8-oxo-dGTP pyrophosphatase MutT (NUDIX family)
MQGAVRETIEETGVLARHPDDGPLLLSIDDHPAGAHRHIDLLYLLVSPPTEPAPAANESPLVKWFEIDKALRYLDFKDEPRIPHNLARAKAWCDANQLPE